MPRTPYQILVIPYVVSNDGTLFYAVLRREQVTGGYWQFVAGGGEDNEQPIEAARRESFEEIGSNKDAPLVKLESMVMIPVVNIDGFKWGDNVLVIPEICFAIELPSKDITLSDEHTEFKWLPYDKAHAILHWDSNKNALWELNHRITHNLLMITK